MRTLVKTLLIALLAGAIYAQTGSPIPWANVQFTDANGAALSGGRVYSCIGGGSCPGTVQATYTSSSLFTANSNPVILDASGRAAIWLTPGLAYTFVVTNQLGAVIPLEGLVNVVGAAASTSSGGGGGGGGSAAGSSTYVQFNTGGNFDASGNFTFNKATQLLTVTGVSNTPGIITAGGAFVQSSGGFLSAVTGGSWQGFNSQTDGAAIRGLNVAQNTANTAGGYLNLGPVTYNPYNGAACVDANGNPVQQPLPLNGLASFGSNSTVMWVTQSPQMPPGGSCGAPLPVQEDWGLAINSYLFARGGLATDNGLYNAINTIYLGGGVPAGGVEAGSIIAGTLYPAGTVTSTGTLTVPTYLGGYVIVGSSNGPPSAGTIATVTNPFVGGSALKEGTLYYDTGADCLEVANNALVFACASAGGGSGTPGGPTTAIQFNNSGVFGGNANLEWKTAAGNTFVNIVATSGTAPGLNVATGFVSADKGFTANVATCLLFNCIQSQGGGMLALNFTAENYSQIGNYNDGTRIGVPPLTSGDASNAGRVYWDCGGAVCSAGTGSAKIFNGTAFVTLATGGATSPGGSNTDVQINSGGSFAGSANLTFAGQKLTVTAASSVSQGVQVLTGFIQSDAGFLATSGVCTLWNCIQTPTGGIYGKSVRAISYMGTGNNNGVPAATSGDTSFPVSGDIFCDTSLGGGACLEKYWNGLSWVGIGSGGGAAAGSNTQIQFNSSGVFGASANLTWNGQDLVAIGVASTQTFYAQNGYAQADGGFLASSSCVLYNCVQAPGGGVFAGKSVRALNYTGTGNSTGVPTATSGDTSFPVRGDMYFDNAAGAERVWNGSAWQTLSTGGIPSLNGLTGALTIAGTASEITVTPSGSTITLTTPQAIATSSSPTFNNITATTSIVASVNVNSSAYAASSAATNAISATNGGIFSHTGFSTPNTALNSIQTAGSVNANNAGGAASGAAYQVNGSTIINSVGQFVGAAVLATGNVQAGGVFAVSGGFFGISHNVVIGSCTMFFQGGILYSTSGC